MESQVGYERLFDPQDIFFSTTDLKGVIQNTNRTFDTLSRYSRERLIGAPRSATFRPGAPHVTSSASSAAVSWPRSWRPWASPPCTT